MTEAVLFWRRTDIEGLERLALDFRPDEIRAQSTVLCLGESGFRLDHSWSFDPDWRTRSVRVERWNNSGHGVLLLEYDGTSWYVDNKLRPDLDGAEEPDLSVTPFCNTFPIRRTPATAGESLKLDTAFIDGVALTVTRSTQRYDRQGPGKLRYIDLGIARGFEADLVVDEAGFVLRYEHLFERIVPPSA